MLHKTPVAALLAPLHMSHEGGATVTQLWEYTFPKAFTAASDLLEFGAIPANTKLLTLDIFSTLAAANTATVKRLTGRFADYDDARELTGNVIVTGSVNSTTLSATRMTLLDIERSGADIPLGLSLSTDVAAKAGKLTFIVQSFG